MADPRKLPGAERLHGVLALQAKVRVVEQVAVIVVLGKVGHGTPANHDIATGESLYRTLGGNEHVVRVVVLVQELGGHGHFVDFNPFPRGDGRSVLLQRAVERIVEEGKIVQVIVLGDEANVVLPGEGEVVFHGETIVVAAELPDDVAGGDTALGIIAGDLEDGMDVAERDQVIAVGVLVNGVDMATVPSALQLVI